MIHTMDQVSHKANTPQLRSSDNHDAAVIARFQNGEAAAFEELVSRHQTRLLRLIRRLLDSPDDAEDVLQDVFVSVFENLSRFRGKARFTTWITTIAVNKCRTHRRRVARRRWLTRLLSGDDSQSTEHWHENLDDEREEVRQAVRTLPPTYREPVVLYYFEQMSVSEISVVLDRKTNAIETRLSRARRMLREILNRRLEGDGQ
jgi:RNA polymerase sigma-70 factor (ECF subfamily)